MRLRFQAMAARTTGMAFQHLFTSIMSYANTDFSPVKPQGSEGDWKNDGYNSKTGQYYQVYSPERFDEAAAIRKINEDFAGLLALWGNAKVYPVGVKEFYFVVNDAYRITPGAYPTTYSTLESLRQKHGLIECKPFLTKDLEDVLMGLDGDKAQTIIGFIPNPAEIKVLRLDLVSEIIGHIINNPIHRSLKQTLPDPDYEEKIVFNRLHHTGSWLRDADFRRGSVEQFFTSNSNFSRQAVRDKLKAIYEVSQIQGFADIDDGPTESDQQFEYILNEITPTPEANNQRLYKDLQDAALVIMAFFFEACDIFEEPKAC